jgi:hypothetical protein
MVYLPLERLLTIATCQARPEVASGIAVTKGPVTAPVAYQPGTVDTGLAARMAANGLRVLLRDGTWQRRRLGPNSEAGEAMKLRLLLWMDRRDEQPGMVALWDMTRAAPLETTAYGALMPRPVLLIGRNVRTGAHFVMRYVPGDWLERLQQVCPCP